MKRVYGLKTSLQRNRQEADCCIEKKNARSSYGQSKKLPKLLNVYIKHGNKLKVNGSSLDVTNVSVRVDKT